MYFVDLTSCMQSQEKKSQHIPLEILFLVLAKVPVCCNGKNNSNNNSNDHRSLGQGSISIAIEDFLTGVYLFLDQLDLNC
jgi:hypothetical protein